VRTVADRQIILAVSDEAFDGGIRRGMTLTQARALCAAVEHAEHDPDRDVRAMEALGRWMMRFSPVVVCGTGYQPVSSGRKKHGLVARATRQDSDLEAIFLDITGCDRLFGGVQNIVSRVSGALSRLGILTSIAVAPTPGAAWALAFSNKDGAIVPPERLESALDPLPVEALRIGEEISESLRHLGLTTIGQVMHLPREVLPARFGSIILKRVDKAMGWVAEPLVALEYRPPVEARMDFDGAVTSLEAIWSVFQNLIGRVIEQLVHRGAGARQMDVELLRNYAPPIRREIFLSRPSRDPANLFNLFRCSLEELEHVSDPETRPATSSVESGRGDAGTVTGRPKAKLRGRRLSPHVEARGNDSQLYDDGFSGLRITVPLFEQLTEEQIPLLDQERHAGQMELDRLIERLRVRLGNESVVRAEFVESYVPEGAWEIGETTRRRGDAETRGIGFSPRPDSTELVAGRVSASPYPSPPRTCRPLHLLPSPVEIRVMVTPSEDAEGDPAAFTHEGVVRPVAHAVGPERIGGRWWDGRDKTRDYFDVADPAGRRFWIFRVVQTAKWYLHGVFE
jgi:protein ImuB